MQFVNLLQFVKLLFRLWWYNICVCIYVLTIYDRPARKCAPRAPGLGNLPRQKSLDSSLAAVQLAMQGSSNNTQGSVSNIYNQWVIIHPSSTYPIYTSSYTFNPELAMP